MHTEQPPHLHSIPKWTPPIWWKVGGIFLAMFFCAVSILGIFNIIPESAQYLLFIPVVFMILFGIYRRTKEMTPEMRAREKEEMKQPVLGVGQLVLLLCTASILWTVVVKLHLPANSFFAVTVIQGVLAYYVLQKNGINFNERTEEMVSGLVKYPSIALWILVTLFTAAFPGIVWAIAQ